MEVPTARRAFTSPRRSEQFLRSFFPMQPMAGFPTHGHGLAKPDIFKKQSWGFPFLGGASPRSPVSEVLCQRLTVGPLRSGCHIRVSLIRGLGSRFGVERLSANVAVERPLLDHGVFELPTLLEGVPPWAAAMNYQAVGSQGEFSIAPVSW